MEKKSEYTEIDRLRDELVVSSWKTLQMQLRAAQNEVSLVLKTIADTKPTVAAAEARLAANKSG